MLDGILRRKREGVTGVQAVFLYPMNALANDQIERLRRLLLVVPYAIAHPGTSIEELADMFGADPRELEQDIAVLGMTGLPPYGGGDNIDAWVDDGQVFVSMTQVLKRPLAMTRPEGLALYLRATEVLAALPEGEAAALRTARDKKIGRAHV